MEQAKIGLPLASPPDPLIWFNSFDWDDIHFKHKGKEVELNILWEEQKEKKYLSVNYSSFWKQYTKCYPDKIVTIVRLFDHEDRLEIDYCDGIDIFDLELPVKLKKTSVCWCTWLF